MWKTYVHHMSGKCHTNVKCMQNICQTHVILCQTYVQHMSDICMSYICQTYVIHIENICKTKQKKCQTYET